LILSREVINPLYAGVIPPRTVPIRGGPPHHVVSGRGSVL